MWQTVLTKQKLGVRTERTSTSLSRHNKGSVRITTSTSTIPINITSTNNNNQQQLLQHQQPRSTPNQPTPPPQQQQWHQLPAKQRRRQPSQGRSSPDPTTMQCFVASGEFSQKDQHRAWWAELRFVPSLIFSFHTDKYQQIPTINYLAPKICDGTLGWCRYKNYDQGQIKRGSGVV